jgi:hypothetical protein
VVELSQCVAAPRWCVAVAAAAFAVPVAFPFAAAGNVPSLRPRFETVVEDCRTSLLVRGHVSRISYGTSAVQIRFSSKSLEPVRTAKGMTRMA